MSIVRTDFIAADEEARRIEIKEWLEANGTEYFDSVTIDEDNVVVTCAIKGGGTLSFFNRSGNYDAGVNVVLKGGSSVNNIRSATSLSILYGVATSKGIMLMTTASSYLYVIFINKSQNGDIILTTSHRDGRSGSGVQSMDFEKSPSIPSAEAVTCIIRQMTTFVPVVVNNVASYAVGLFLMVQAQSTSYTGQITADGKNYFTDGVWALEE